MTISMLAFKCSDGGVTEVTTIRKIEDLLVNGFTCNGEPELIADDLMYDRLATLLDSVDLITFV